MTPSPKIEPKFHEYQRDTMTARARKILENDIWLERIIGVEALLAEFDKGITEHLALTTPTSPALHRFIRFCIPIFEILESKKKAVLGDEHVRQMAATLLWTELWRPLDNLLDGQAPRTGSLMEFSQALTRADNFSAMHLLAGKVPRADICQYLFENIAVEDNKYDRESFSQIYKRARVFETIDLLIKFPMEVIDLHHQYINITGFAHDVIDFLDDLKNEVPTFPQRIWRELGGSEGFSFAKLRSFENRCTAIANRETRRFASKFNSPPVVTLSSVDDICSWAFGVNFVGTAQ